MLQSTLNRCTLCALSVVFAVVLGISLIGAVQPSHADEEADTLESQIKQSAEAYNDALERQAKLAQEIAVLDERIADLESKLPAQRERSDESIRALYKYKNDSSSVLMMMLESTSVTDMLAIIDSYNWILEYNQAEIRAAVQMETELKDSRARLANDKVSVDQATQDAYASLEAAKAARERAAQRAAEAQKAEQTQLQEIIASGGGSDAEREAANSAGGASAGNVDWSADKNAFVNQWAPRINAYLAGSPMAGTGVAYAAAAWDNGVDPRWAPAISFVESSKGAVCFRSYNAWGYGRSGFSSWEEGIYKVVSSLGSSLYGGYLTLEAASTYCPTNPEHWYNTCAAQMALI